MESAYQTSSAEFAAACTALGIACRMDVMEHLPDRSDVRQKIYITYHLTGVGEHFPRTLHNELSTGQLAQTTPGHPIFAALAAIETYQRLDELPAHPLSLVPYRAEHYAQGFNRCCVLRKTTQNDGNLLDLRPPAPHKIKLNLPLATVALVGGFRFEPYRYDDGLFHVPILPSIAFQGLELNHLAESWVRFNDQIKDAGTAPSHLNPQGITTLAHAMPGHLPGEHPLQYAMAAVRIYQAYTGARTKKAQSYLFTSNFSALVPANLTPAEQDLTKQFLTRGGAVFQF